MRYGVFNKTRWMLMFACILLVSGAYLPVHAARQSLKQAHPFAQHFLVLQLSDASPAKQTQVLEAANNVLKFYGPDKVAIDVVTFGPGVHLLFARNKNAKMVNSLAVQGVRFDICGNTLDTIKREKGSVPPLNANAVRIQAGIPRIMELVGQGYVLVRP